MRRILNDLTRLLIVLHYDVLWSIFDDSFSHCELPSVLLSQLFLFRVQSLKVNQHDVSKTSLSALSSNKRFPKFPYFPRNELMLFKAKSEYLESGLPVN